MDASLITLGALAPDAALTLWSLDAVIATLVAT
jgi:hypothetical protein